MVPALVPIGAGIQLGGMASNAYGQHLGLRAMQDAWGRDQAIQNAYNARLGQVQTQYLNQVNPTAIFNPAGAQQAEGQLTRDATMTAQAAAPGRGGAEGQAAAGQAQAGLLARSIQQGHAQAFLQALQQGQHHLDMLGRQYGIDANHIRNDAAQWGALAQQHQQTASMQGSQFRQAGTLLQGLGQGVMSYGMSQPAMGQAAGFAPDAGATDLAYPAPRYTPSYQV